MWGHDLAKIWATQKFLYHVIDKYEPLVLSCSFGAPEGMALIDILSKITKNLTVCTIDTGRLPPATYELIDRALRKYKFTLDTIYPEYSLLKEMVAKKGMNSFYESVDNRKECCNIRKVIPFKNYLRENRIRAVVTGLRQEQSIERETIRLIELDKYENCAKLNPMYAWTRAKVMEYVEQHSVPINSLHQRGYESVGCEPCTRAGSGRDGRWWWENSNSKECGLHEQGSGI
jgi:phosphoadenosine phosphosulfate reductase